MRSRYSKIKHALDGLLLSDDPLMEFVIIMAPAKEIHSVAARMGMKVWTSKAILVHSSFVGGRALTVYYSGVKVLPDNWRPPK